MPSGDFDYERGGIGYAVQRRTDPRIAARIHAALGSARSVVNVGAGAGSYEPEDRLVLAVEPSAAMRAQRPPHRVRALPGVAESLPFRDAAFDAAMATVTLHQWGHLEKGLQELRRVARGPLVLLTFDPDALDRFWLAVYAPELIAAERKRYPTMARLRELLGDATRIETVPIPIDCVDGFTEAFYARPERMLAPEVRKAQSAWGFVEFAAQERAVARLRTDLDSGAWDVHWGALRTQPEFEGSLRLVVASGAT